MPTVDRMAPRIPPKMKPMKVAVVKTGPVNDSKNSENMRAIRSHLTHIVAMFSNGEFSISMFVHDQVPPGVPVMKDKHAEISYSFEELPAGGRVHIKTTNPEALKAIHDFLRFQIGDHHTGDTTDIGSAYAITG